jgi:hypothetical protein
MSRLLWTAISPSPTPEMSDKLAANREPLLRSSHQTSMTRTRKWSRVIVVCLAAIFAIHGWMHICHTSQTDPYSTIPSGGPGVVVVTPCGDGLECGYIKYVNRAHIHSTNGYSCFAAYQKTTSMPQRVSRTSPSQGSKRQTNRPKEASCSTQVCPLLLSSQFAILTTLQGGPGGSGTRQASAKLSRMLSDDYDLIGFDPRGIGRTR